MSLDRDQIDTSHGYFLKAPTDRNQPPVAIILRGVNLSSSSKFPSVQEDVTGLDEEALFWDEAEKGGRDGWFVNHPLAEHELDVHLRRLVAWGFRVIRLIVTWEGLEHFPGQYDETYIDYLIRLLSRCKTHGLCVFISAHQDVFSRFTGGSGAPLWALQALGLCPRRVHQTGAAILHRQWASDGWGGVEGRAEAAENDFTHFPDMIWNTNLHRLASRHCFTMFFASHVFAPKCTIDGKPVGLWLQEKHVEAYGHLADRLAQAGDLLDGCVIGWDTMNEPHEGFIGIPDLNEIPPAQEFRKGPSPTPLQGFQLGVGQPVKEIAYDDFTSLGHKKLGKVAITPPDGQGVWQTRAEADAAAEQYGWRWGDEWAFWDLGGCPWAGHQVWDPESGRVIKPDYFEGDSQGHEYDFMEQFWRPYIQRIRRAHPDAITFVNPPVFGSPPDLSEDVKRGRVALSPHFYDGLTMLGKRRHKFIADAVGLQRGNVGLLDALKIGTSKIKAGLHAQFQELKSDARRRDGIAENTSGKKEYPTLIGELGVPFDMKPTGMFGLARGKKRLDDYREPTKSMNELLAGCDGTNALSYTLWNYEPTNTHEHGDHWNGEDLSIFTLDDLEDRSVAADPPNLRSLVLAGARGIDAWCRPYPVETMGRVQSFTFDMSTTMFKLKIQVVSHDTSALWQSREPDRIVEEGFTLIYLPFVHYLKSEAGETGDGRLVGVGGEEWAPGVPGVVDLEIVNMSVGRLAVDGQWGRWYYPLDSDREVELVLRKWT